MNRRIRSWSILVAAVVVLAGAGVSLARASVDDVAGLGLVPSLPPAILGPITALGRSGWDCAPERAARSASADHADLPADSAP